MNKKMLWAGLSIFIIFITGLIIYRYQNEAGVSVQVFSVRKENIKEILPASGVIEVVEKDDVTAKTNALVQEVLITLWLEHC